MASIPFQRLQTVANHIRTCQSHVCYCQSKETSPTLHVVPELGLLDEPVQISVSGLKPYQRTTIVAHTEEGGAMFHSFAVYKANGIGVIDLEKAEALSGTFKGKEPMGLFWSMVQAPGQPNGVRLMTKDASIPRRVTLSVLGGEKDVAGVGSWQPIAQKTVQRLSMSDGVRRRTVRENDLRGTMFYPTGLGPFPTIIDLFGGLSAMVETRAALLASHGFATFALTYMLTDHLPRELKDIRLQYFLTAVEWLKMQPLVDVKRLGVIGSSFGGTIAMAITALLPEIRALAVVNGIPFANINLEPNEQFFLPVLEANQSKSYRTEEGIVIRDTLIATSPGDVAPAWRNGAKIHLFAGEDDHLVHSNVNYFLIDVCPEDKRDNIEITSYPGAGHTIEPPYQPLYRVQNAFSKNHAVKMVSKELREQCSIYVLGGYPKQHAFAQEDSWSRILKFFRTNL